MSSGSDSLYFERLRTSSLIMRSKHAVNDFARRSSHEYFERFGEGADEEIGCVAGEGREWMTSSRKREREMRGLGEERERERRARG